MSKSLREITSQEVLKTLPRETLDTLLSDFYLPFLYRVENVLDNISNNNLVNTEILRSFCKTFPQFVHKSKHQVCSIGVSTKYSAFYFINDNIIPDQPKELYKITTYQELNPVVNNDLLKFFISRDIPIWCGLSVRKSSDQWEPLCD